MQALTHLALLTLLAVTSGPAKNAATPPGPASNTTVPPAPPSNTTVPSGPPSNTTVPSGPPSNTTVPSGPPSNTTVPSGPPSNTTVPPAPSSNTTVPSGPPSNTTVPPAPSSNTTVPSGPPSNTTVPPAPPSNTTVPSGPPSNTTVPPAPPSNTTVPSGPPSNTTVPSGPPSNTTVPSGPPSNTTVPSGPPSNTTVPPGPPSNTTVPPAPPSNTTVPSGPPSNTTVPPAPPSNTTVPSGPPSNTTVPSGPPSNTTVPPAPPSNTTTPAGNVPSVTSSSATSPNTSNPNAGVCQRDTCGKDSSCVALNNTHFCLCVDGYYYKSSMCNKGKVFPGTIQLKVSETSDLENEKSVAYEKLHMEVTNFFQNAFTNSDFGQTVIYKVRLSVSARSEMRADEKLVDVTVVNLFAETTQEDETTVNNKIEKAISSNSKTFTSYNKQDLCDFYGCIKTNDQDNCNSGLLCTCKPGLERPNPQTPSCLDLGPKCSDDCRAEHNMQCVVRSNRSAACLCLPGYQKDQRGACQACAFGYSGVNCEDKFELILTIVGTIAGILILGMLIALIVTRSKKKRGIEEENLIENDFNGLRMQQTTDFSNLGAGGSIFPKVRASVPTSSQMQNPYAQRGMPRPDY